jgi:hypothetical protein
MERASVHVVAAGDPTTPPAADPDAALPVQPPPEPPQEPTVDVGGPVLPNPAPEEQVEAMGGGLAARMRARYNAIAATEEFAVPGWETADGSPGLIIVARAFGDRRTFNEGTSNEVFIAKSTHRLIYVDDDGSRHEIEGGWGPQLAEMIGVNVSKAADLVARVISKPNPSDPTQRIPNVAGIGALATEMIEWARRGTREAEEDLGE